MAKEVNREDYARKRHYHDRKKKYVIEQLKWRYQSSIDEYDKQLQKGLKDCNCQKDPNPKKGVNHNDVCSHKEFQNLQQKKTELTKYYIYFKTDYNHDRRVSPEYHFARQIYLRNQNELLKVKVKQNFLKGKNQNVDNIY